VSRASEELFDLIHSLVAGSLADELKRAAARAALPTDDANYAPLNPQLIDKARAFLKDNGIDTPAKSQRVDTLAHQLADLDLDDEAVRIRPN
jgi:hypothetical protein